MKPFVWEARRAIERQYYYFWKWRNKYELARYWVPIEYAMPSAKKVTWTINSKHLSWNAVDVVFDISEDPKVQVPSWNWNYKRLIEIGKEVGLRNLAPYELCHFEDDGTPFSYKKKKKMTERAKRLLIISLMNLCSSLYDNISDEIIKDLLSKVNKRFRELWFDNE